MTLDTSKVSKTTLIGLLMLGITAMQAVKFDVAGHLCMSAKDWMSVGLAVAFAAVAALQKDAQ